MAEVPICDVCSTPVTPNPELAERQGQKVEVRFAAFTQEMWLCPEHLAPLLDQWGEIGERRLFGTMPLSEAPGYLPRLD